eukprot:3940567-Rhodomonas_salina.1
MSGTVLRICCGMSSILLHTLLCHSPLPSYAYGVRYCGTHLLRHARYPPTHLLSPPAYNARYHAPILLRIMPLSSYASAMPCPLSCRASVYCYGRAVLSERMELRICGTERAYSATDVHVAWARYYSPPTPRPYAVPGTGLAYAASALRTCYAMSGTGIADRVRCWSRLACYWLAYRPTRVLCDARY